MALTWMTSSKSLRQIRTFMPKCFHRKKNFWVIWISWTTMTKLTWNTTNGARCFLLESGIQFCNRWDQTTAQSANCVESFAICAQSDNDKLFTPFVLKMSLFNSSTINRISSRAED